MERDKLTDAEWKEINNRYGCVYNDFPWSRTTRDAIDAILVQRPEAPALVCSKCGNILGCVSCYNEDHAPAPRTFTVEQVEKAVADEAAYQQMSLPSAFIPNLRFRLDPPKPKPKTPEERVNAILVHHLGNEYVVKHTIAAEIVAELAKERP